MQYRDIDTIAPGAGLDCGGAGVARGRPDDRHARIASSQNVVEQPPDKLQRHVLERERRSVEQLLHEQPGVELDQRHHRGMAEAGIGVAAQRGERGRRNGVTDERLDHMCGEHMVRQAAQGTPVGRRELRPGLRHIEPAVLSEAGQQHAGEVKYWRLTAGGDVAHGLRPAPRHSDFDRLSVLRSRLGRAAIAYSPGSHYQPCGAAGQEKS